MNKKQRKFFGWTLIVGFLALAGAYVVLFKGNTLASDGEYFYIRSEDSYEKVRENLIYNNIVKHVPTFDIVANQFHLPEKFKPGRYKIHPNMSNLELIRMIRSGNWEKVVIKLKPEMSRDSVLTYLADNLQASRKEIKNYLQEDWVKENGFTSENVWCIFLPDHYHFNWATPANKIIERFVDEYNTYWNEERKEKAKALNLSTKQACVLASIVDAEAIHVSEMATIAGLYLNRINKGIMLQADPTVLYVVGREGRRRVLNSDLKKQDPYNTYLNLGLPPGPVFLPDKRAIEASINPQKHDYIFMCAKPDGSFRHNFTSSAAQHLRNAADYRRSLNKQGIMR